ncbi:MAG TPA: flagellin [Magnetospirillum sp.]|nr:flagellin [Magnetospirillum sp.]
MSRIGSYGASQLYLYRIGNINQRINETQVQVSTELKSTVYSGVASDANRIINLENEKKKADSYVRDNAMAETRLKAASVSLDAIRTSMNNMKKRLDEFAATMSTDKNKVEQIQDFAFDAMMDIQSYLAANVDGQYIFSGGRVADQPVELPASTLKDFQALYDGSSVTYPTTRSASLYNLDTTSADTGQISFNGANGTINAPSLTTSPNVLSAIPTGTRITVNDTGGGANDNKTFTVRGVTVDGTGTHLSVSPLTSEVAPGATITYKDAAGVTNTVTSNLTFNPGTDTISSTVATGMTAGQVFTIAGTTGNNETYEVAGIVAGPPDTITVRSTKVTTQALSSNIELKAESWYKGDTLALQHRIDTDRSVDVGIYASDPAFEKAFRALGLIAQGTYGSAGGLDNNLERINQARSLMQDAVTRNGNGAGPFGQEQSGDVDNLQSRVGITLNVIKTKNEKHKSYAELLNSRVADMERVDKTEAVAKLLDDQNALQTSYQALATVRQLNLINYLK